MGYFRDDATLSDLILDDKGKKELDTLWQEFDFIADYTIRTWDQFVFDGGGGGRGGNPMERPSFAEATSQATIFRYRDHYLANAAPANNPAVMRGHQGPLRRDQLRDSVGGTGAQGRRAAPSGRAC